MGGSNETVPEYVIVNGERMKQVPKVKKYESPMTHEDVTYDFNGNEIQTSKEYGNFIVEERFVYIRKDPKTEAKMFESRFSVNVTNRDITDETLIPLLKKLEGGLEQLVIDRCHNLTDAIFNCLKNVMILSMIGCQGINGSNLEILKKKNSEDLTKLRMNECNSSFTSNLAISGLDIRTIETSSYGFFDNEIKREVDDIASFFKLNSNRAGKKRKRGNGAAEVDEDGMIESKNKKRKFKEYENSAKIDISRLKPSEFVQYTV